MQRRTAFVALGASVLGGTAAGPSQVQAAKPVPQNPAAGPEGLAEGPSAVVLGNPSGDVTVVEFFDYQCPFCRRAHPDVEVLVAQDPKLRLVHKHWPVFGAASTYAARLALAARWQKDRYGLVHDALMRLPGRLDEASVAAAAAKTGVDMAVIARDLRVRASEIDAALGEAAAQARGIGLKGTPAFVIGRFLIPGALDLTAMREVVDKVRADAVAPRTAR